MGRDGIRDGSIGLGKLGFGVGFGDVRVIGCSSFFVFKFSFFVFLLKCLDFKFGSFLRLLGILEFR